MVTVPSFNLTYFKSSILVNVQPLTILPSLKILSPNINLNYSLEKFLLHDTSWDNHRLTSAQKKGWTNSLSLILEKESYEIQSKLSHQSFNLDNAQNSKGLSLKINILNSF